MFATRNGQENAVMRRVWIGLVFALALTGPSVGLAQPTNPLTIETAILQRVEGAVSNMSAQVVVLYQQMQTCTAAATTQDQYTACLTQYYQALLLLKPTP